MGAPTRKRWMHKQDAPKFVGLGILLGVLVSGVLGLSLWAWMATGQTRTPVQVGKALVDHSMDFTSQYFIAFGIVLLVFLVVFLLGLWIWRKTMPRPSWVDVAGQHMASAKELKSLSRKAATKKARELGVKGTGK